MPLTHSLVFSFRAILKKSSDFYKVSQEILKSLIPFFKMACSKPIEMLFIPGCHHNQATFETLQELLAEAGIPCEIHSVFPQKSLFSEVFVQVKLIVSFAPNSEKIQEEIRSPFGMRVNFYLNGGRTEKHLILKEYRESPVQDTPAPKRQPPPLMEDVMEFPPISGKSSNPPQQNPPQPQQPQQQQQPQPQQKRQLQHFAHPLEKAHRQMWNEMLIRQHLEQEQMRQFFAAEVREFQEFAAYKQQKLSKTNPAPVVDTTQELSKESSPKTSHAEAATAQEEPTKDKTVDFAESEKTSHFKS